jgi:hypothetical protein
MAGISLKEPSVVTAAPIDATSYERALRRLKELEELEHAMIEHRAALVHGPAGVGKTRLLRTFADGRKGFVYTAETEGPGQLLKGLARQLSECSMLSGRRFSYMRVDSRSTVPPFGGAVQADQGPSLHGSHTHGYRGALQAYGGHRNAVSTRGPEVSAN